MELREWGNDGRFSAGPGETLGRVVEEQKTQLLVVTSTGPLPAQLTGKLLQADRLERPLVGDFVSVRILPAERKAVIQSVLPRASLLKRKAPGTDDAIQPLAANVDLAFVVTSANRDFNLARLDRYLTVIGEAGARAAIVLTKRDLDSAAADELLAELRAKYPAVTAIATSQVTGEGLPALAGLLEPARTHLFIGSSGVGKSTLVNLLLGEAALATAPIREDDDRGRHTTTFRRLVRLPNGPLVIDTPGMREIQLESSHRAGLERAFAEIEELARGCKFANCGHRTEPGCAVKAAVASGVIDEECFASYSKLAAQLPKGAAKSEKSGLKRAEKGKYVRKAFRGDDGD